jgi:4-hydroxy-3-methylbut-2-en-1-yl diphosphate synthase IspG/GcpE
VGAMVESALEHAQMLDDLGFTRFVVSLKDSDDELYRAAEELGINISTRFESSSVDEI